MGKAAVPGARKKGQWSQGGSDEASLETSPITGPVVQIKDIAALESPTGDFNCCSPEARHSDMLAKSGRFPALSTGTALAAALLFYP